MESSSPHPSGEHVDLVLEDANAVGRWGGRHDDDATIVPGDAQQVGKAVAMRSYGPIRVAVSSAIKVCARALSSAHNR